MKVCTNFGFLVFFFNANSASYRGGSSSAFGLSELRKDTSLAKDTTSIVWAEVTLFKFGLR